MKFFLGIFSISVGLLLGACQTNCIKCSGTTVCEDDYNNSTTGVSWEDYKAQKIQSGECTEN